MPAELGHLEPVFSAPTRSCRKKCDNITLSMSKAMPFLPRSALLSACLRSNCKAANFGAGTIFRELGEQGRPRKCHSCAEAVLKSSTSTWISPFWAEHESIGGCLYSSATALTKPSDASSSVPSTGNSSNFLPKLVLVQTPDTHEYELWHTNPQEPACNTTHTKPSVSL